MTANMLAEATCSSNTDPVEDPPNPEPEPDSLEDALYDDNNALVAMRLPGLADEYRKHIESEKEEIEETIQNLLGVRWCRVMTSQLWKSGSFNLAIPIYLPQDRTMYLRLPFPYRLGESQCPGNVEEKLRTEIATYSWISKNCADVPIPTLHAFGLPDGSTYTRPDDSPFIERVWSYVQHIKRRLFGQPAAISHIRRRVRHSLDYGFLLLSKARGKSLAFSWGKHCQEKAYRENLFRSLARISLSLHSIPFNRIGALSLQPNMSIAMTNRPLHLYFHMLENEGIPSGIPRDRTYAETEAYISDLITVQDNKLRHQPNAIHDVTDCRKQLAALTALRAVMHHFIKPELRDGPFFYTLTDLHPSNIFVDEHWNVVDIIDLEWAHSMPLQMQRPPFWLTSRGVDGFDNDAALSEYATVLDEYFQTYETEERRRNRTDFQTSVYRDMWHRGSFWYFHAAAIPAAMYGLFNKRIQPLFNKEHARSTAVDDVLHYYWGQGLDSFTARKLADKEQYLVNVREQYRALSGGKKRG
ncbi:phosphotransferase enzyme family protein [Beauveria bassiana ARSEF 2860]|uniref:Phosphotransferase enzyme family protein n=1 Tax=Beauveria bassiana (strain ARSEF 2860) TaxID=655819 RepID=J5JW74_BEAB2|nr:phosphotransferase enzyme family protein [Beauveria bassiana ARSEF 2860]EJP66626.1 phosphotransferase enzyme family protein [Beauveria bassiana ARSEF 2860]